MTEHDHERTLTLPAGSAFATVQNRWQATMVGETWQTAVPREQQTVVSEHLLLPQRLVGSDADSDYQVGERIGSGGMGAVYWARQRGLARRIALKRMHESKLEDPTSRSAFVTEALVTAQLEHPNIIPVHELCSDARGHPFYTMKPVHGRPWSQCRRDFSLSRNLDILLTLCDAVAYAHARGVLHRDIKPANVMIGPYGEVVLMDWGLAVAVPGCANPAAPSLTGVQGEAAVGGTPAYMPPEMAMGDGDLIGIHSDVYLLGAVLFELLNDEPPHDGNSIANCMRNAAANRIVPGKKQAGELSAIAVKALAAKPEERYPDVSSFRTAVSDYRAHAMSMQLSERAQERLLDAVDGSDYDAFARSLYGFEEALGLWSENRSAIHGRQEARWAYAAAALERDDLDLAASLIEDDPEGLDDLHRQLQQARLERERSQQAQRRLARVEAQRNRERDRKWHVLATEDFADESFHDRWQVISPGRMWHPGELRLWGGSPALIVLRDEAPGDVRLSFEVRLEGNMLNDISCFLAASPSVENPAELRKEGYEFKYGAYENTRVCLYRAGVLVYDRRESPLEYGRTYHVEAERIGQVLRMRIDGGEVVSWQDDEVLAGGTHHSVGIVAWGAEYCYSNLRVERLGAPLRADLLTVAADHLSRGHVNTAADLYADVLAAAVDPNRREQAQEGLDRALALQRLAAELPDYQTRISRAWPQAKIRLIDDGLLVDIDDLDIEDLEPLRGLPIRSLNCSGNRITSLDPLCECPLRELHAASNRIRLLDPLRDTPLVVLDCSDNRIKSLAPLANLPLEELRVADNRIADLSPLRNLRLTTLDCARNLITSLAALNDQPLVRMDCTSNRIRDLSPLLGGNLAHLECGDNDIADIACLADCPLRAVVLDGNPVSDLRPLQAHLLERLSILFTGVDDLGPVSEPPPSHFAFAAPGLGPAHLRAVAARWEQDPAWRPLAIQAEALAALRDDDERMLRKLARPVGLVRVLYMPEPLAFTAARDAAERLGGRLCCPAMPEEDLALRLLMPPDAAAWIGLAADADRWDDGRQLHDHRLRDHDPVLPGGVLWHAQAWKRIPAARNETHGWLLAFPNS